MSIFNKKTKERIISEENQLLDKYKKIQLDLNQIGLRYEEYVYSVLCSDFNEYEAHINSNKSSYDRTSFFRMYDFKGCELTFRKDIDPKLIPNSYAHKDYLEIVCKYSFNDNSFNIEKIEFKSTDKTINIDIKKPIKNILFKYFISYKISESNKKLAVSNTSFAILDSIINKVDKREQVINNLLS